MTDNGNQPRPVRTLTVKNFSVIKEAKLEFGKITVLIGPQSSGKSLICKLAYFFQKVVIEQAEKSIREARHLDTLRMRVADEFLHTWFPAFGPEAGAQIDYVDGRYDLSLSFSASGGFHSSGSTSAGVRFSSEIEDCYNSILSSLESDRNLHGEADARHYAQEIKSQLEGLQNSSAEVYSYIPSTRSFFVTPQKAILGTSQRSDPITLRFSQDFSLDYQKSVPQSGLNHELTGWVNDEFRRILHGEVVEEGNFEAFQTEDGRKVPLTFLSSGTQELLPLAMCLQEFTALSGAVAKTLDIEEALHRRLFFIEEPEANIFPSTQYDLVRVFARMSNEPLLDASWVITTHSPYILSAFNNLIEAAQVAAAKPELKGEVAHLIPEQYWIKEGDFKAYAIQEGVLRSIVAEDTGLVSANYLDQVSETIGMQFDELLRLGYVES